MAHLFVYHNGTQVFTANNMTTVPTPEGQNFFFTDDNPPPPPAGRLNTAFVTWVAHPSFSQNTDMTQYKNCAGVIAPHQTPHDWPYLSGPLFKWQMPAGKYVAFRIDVPAAGPISYHFLKNPIYQNGCAMRLSLSTLEGDFNPATVLAIVQNVIDDDRPVLHFTNGPGTDTYTHLAPGSSVYLNIQPMDGTTQQLCAIASQ